MAKKKEETANKIHFDKYVQITDLDKMTLAFIKAKVKPKDLKTKEEWDFFINKELSRTIW